MIASPVLFDIQVNQGDRIERIIEIKNDTKQSVSYELSSENFISSGEEGGQLYLTNSSKTDLASWITWANQVVSVGPGSTIKIPVSIQIPNNAEPGGHYATVFFSQKSSNQKESNVGMMQQVGVLFLIRVNGEISERAMIESYILRSKTNVITHLPVNFDLRIRNQGSVHIRPQGDVVITNALGNVVAKIPVNSKQGAVLPNGIRHFEIQWNKGRTNDGKKSFWNDVKSEWNQFAIGRYTAEVRVMYGLYSEKIPQEKITFWIFPWHLMLVALMVIIGLILTLKLYNKCLVCCLISRSDAARSKCKTTRHKSS